MCKIAIALLGLVAVASAAVLQSTEQVPILSQDQDIHPDGSFRTKYETGNGIQYEEQGVSKVIGEEAPVVSQGSFSYPGEDGRNIQVTWTADENGYHAQGEHLPVAPVGPEIPPAIARAIEWIKTHPQVDSKKP